MSTRRPGDDSLVPLPEGCEVQLLASDLALLSFPLPLPAVCEALTDAEREVALQVYAGMKTKDIARARGVSARTVSNQLESIYRKLGVRSRHELVLRLHGRSR